MRRIADEANVSLGVVHYCFSSKEALLNAVAESFITVSYTHLDVYKRQVLTVTQTDIKRLLAYSSIAHAGFILVGFLAFDRSGVNGVLFYLAAYGFTTVAAFGMSFLVRDLSLIHI